MWVTSLGLAGEAGIFASLPFYPMFSGVPNGPLRLSPPQVHAAVHNSGDNEVVAESDENNNTTADPNSIDLIVCVDPEDENCFGDLDDLDSPAVCTPTEGSETSCTDREDNDCDGLIDSADPNCPCTITAVFEVGASCTDRLDNDCDGLIDLEDPGCQGR